MPIFFSCLFCVPLPQWKLQFYINFDVDNKIRDFNCKTKNVEINWHTVTKCTYLERYYVLCILLCHFTLHTRSAAASSIHRAATTKTLQKHYKNIIEYFTNVDASVKMTTRLLNVIVYWYRYCCGYGYATTSIKSLVCSVRAFWILSLSPSLPPSLSLALVISSAKKLVWLFLHLKANCIK